MKQHQQQTQITSAPAPTVETTGNDTGIDPTECAKQALAALGRGDLGAFCTWAGEQAEGAGAIMGGLRSGKLRVDDETTITCPSGSALAAAVQSGADGLSSEQRASLVRFCEHLDHAAQIQLFDWLRIPVQSSSGSDVDYDDESSTVTGMGTGSFFGEDELPLVLQGLLQLPTRFWYDPATLGTYQGIQPGPAAAYTSGNITTVTLDTRVETAREGAAADTTEDTLLAQGKQAFADGVSHEIGHSVDNAMAAAHATLMAELGYQLLPEVTDLLDVPGMLDGADETHRTFAERYLQRWMGRTGHPDSHGAMEKEMAPLGEAMSVSDPWDQLGGTSLTDVLVASANPAALEKTQVGGAHYALYQKAGEVQVWGHAMAEHLTTWANPKAALSDREYCAELFRCYFQAPAAQRPAILQSYPEPAQRWIQQAQAFDGRQ